MFHYLSILRELIYMFSVFHVCDYCITWKHTPLGNTQLNIGLWHMPRLNQHTINQHCLRDNSSGTRVVEQSITLYHNHMDDDVTSIFVYKQTPLIMWWIRWDITKNTEMLLCNIFSCISYGPTEIQFYNLSLSASTLVKFTRIMIQPHKETLESVNPLQIQFCIVRVKGQPSCPQSCVLCKARGLGLC